MISDDTAIPRVGTTLAGKYRLGRLLGEGGMGAVYEGTNTWTERRVAIKVMRSEFLKKREAVSRFLREARAATRISHPNIVDVLDMGEDTADGTLFIVQEFLTGSDLRDALDQKRKLSPKDAYEALVPIMGALVAAHQLGIVHRDLKPENIFLATTPSGTVPKLIDFGIAKLADGDDQRLTKTASALGTPYYMSPEQARGEKSIDAQSDVWAMGVVWFEALAGRCPYEGENYNQILSRVLTEPVPRVDALEPAVPRSLADVIARAVTKERAQRFQSMEQFLGALLGCKAFERDEWMDTVRTTVRAANASGSADELLVTPAIQPAVARPARATTLGGKTQQIERTPRRSTSPLLVMGALGVLVVAGASIGAILAARGRNRDVARTAVPAAQPPGTYAVAFTTDPSDAQISVDGVREGAGAFAREYPRDQRTHAVIVSADGFESMSLAFDAARTPPGRISLTRAAVVAPSPSPAVATPSPLQSPPIPRRVIPSPVATPRPALAPARAHTAPAAAPFQNTPPALRLHRGYE